MPPNTEVVHNVTLRKCKVISFPARWMEIMRRSLLAVYILGNRLFLVRNPETQDFDSAKDSGGPLAFGNLGFRVSKLGS